MIFNIRALVLAAVLCPTLAAAVEGEDCRYGDSGSMCWPGGWGDGPPPMPSAPGSPPAPPGIDLSRGWIPQAPVPTGVGFGGGPGASSSSMTIVRASAADTRMKSGGAVVSALRPQGPCYRPGPTTYPGILPFPKGTTFYVALDPTSTVDTDMWNLFKTTLSVAVDRANQYFGSQPATSLLGHTAKDDGFDPPLYAFKVFDTTLAATAAAAADGGPKLVVRMYNGRSVIRPTGGETQLDYNRGETAGRAQVMIDFEFIEEVRKIAVDSGLRFPEQATRQVMTKQWLHYIIPHELFGHVALTLEHITKNTPIDDDNSPMVYSGNRLKSIGDNVLAPIPPVSACDMVHGWVSR